MSYVDIVIYIGSLPILETWPPIYRGQERTMRERLKASQVYTHVYFRYTPCLTDFTFEFIRRPISPILSPSSRTFVELTLVTRKSNPSLRFFPTRGLYRRRGVVRRWARRPHHGWVRPGAGPSPPVVWPAFGPPPSHLRSSRSFGKK
jgi:hypothetical protein